MTEYSKYLKIDEAARLLGVSTRWVYRRIWNGDLPASKVGGLYFIDRHDLQALLEQRKGGGAWATSETGLPTGDLKCGVCFRLLTGDQQISEVCEAPGCEKLICQQCYREGQRYCAQHSPTREQKLEQAEARLKAREIPLLVKANHARLLELNFLNRLQARITAMASLVHPLTGEVIDVPNWDHLQESGDDRKQVMFLLGKVVMDSKTLAQQPLNSWLRYTVSPPPRFKANPLMIYIQVLSRLEQMLRDGFDTQPLGSDELLPWLERISDEAASSKSFLITVLAATTGWDPSALRIIQGDQTEGRGATIMAFAHRQALVYLFDLQKGALLYNPRDERARQYTELFVPLLPSEELEEAAEAIRRELISYQTLTLQYAVQVLPYSATVIQRAFESLAAGGDYSLVQVPEYGLAIVRRT